MKIKKFYYYSPEKLKLVPIKNLKKKILLGISLVTFVFISLAFGAGNLFFSNSNNAISEDVLEANEELSKELVKLESKYISLNKKFNQIAEESNLLRLSVNLEPLDAIDRKIGVGGSVFGSSVELTTEHENKKVSEVHAIIKNIESNFNFELSNYSEIKEKFSENKKLFQSIPAIKPVFTPIGNRFGMRFHPILKIRRMHNGLDFLANTGESVYAPGNGVISYVGRKGGYGKVVKIDHGFGYATLYAHLSKIEVKKGQKIERGELIAKTGNTGSLSTGPHLHYEVMHNGIRLNPRNFIFDDVKLFDIRQKNIIAKN